MYAIRSYYGVWRAVTEPAEGPAEVGEPKLLQVVQQGSWAYPVYADGSATRVLPAGGIPSAELKGRRKNVFRLDRKTA